MYFRFVIATRHIPLCVCATAELLTHTTDNDRRTRPEDYKFFAGFRASAQNVICVSAGYVGAD